MVSAGTSVGSVPSALPQQLPVLVLPQSVRPVRRRQATQIDQDDQSQK